MSIINNAQPGSSIRLLNLIDRTLARRKGKPILREELIEICRPESLPGSPGASERFESNLNFWLKEGLWFEDEAGVRMPEAGNHNRRLWSRVLDLIIENNTDVDISQGNRTEPFLRTISCLLAQDKYTFFGGDVLKPGVGGNFAEVINNRLPSSLSINITNEASTMLEYGRFLGFIEPIGDHFIVDPTQAVESVIGSVFSKKRELPARDFLAGLADCLPMLDGGVYREKIEPLMIDKGWARPSTPQISASLSHALYRLNLSSKLTLEHRSDDVKSISMVLPNEVRPVSIVKYREPAL